MPWSLNEDPILLLLSSKSKSPLGRLAFTGAQRFYFRSVAGIKTWEARVRVEERRSFVSPLIAALICTIRRLKNQKTLFLFLF